MSMNPSRKKILLVSYQEEFRLTAHQWFQGEKLDFKRHRLKTEIKAVTYHQLKVQKVKDTWQAEVIFDV